MVLRPLDLRENAWKTHSFVGLGSLWVLGNETLTPSDCKIRKIVDMGSIRDSVDKSGIDLFDREVLVEQRFNEWQCGLMRVVTMMGIITVGSNLGAAWHAGHTVYHVAVWVGKRGESESDIEAIKQHALSFFHDFAIALGFQLRLCEIIKKKVTVLPHLNFYVNLLEKYPQLPFATIIFKLPLALALGIASRSYVNEKILTSKWMTRIDEDQVLKSYMMKKHFGLMSERDILLSYGPDKDRELENTDGIGPGNQSMKVVAADSHFMTLLTTEANEFLMTCKDMVTLLDLNLTPQVQAHYSSNPKEILSDLRKRHDPPLKKSELDPLLKKAEKHLKNYELLIAVFKETLQVNEFHSGYFADGTHDMFFQPHIKPQTPLESFYQQLQILREKHLPNTGHNSKYIAIKERILKAKTPFDVLGVTEGDPDIQKKINRAYKHECSLAFHPDKVPKEWQEEATDIFGVINQAYQAITDLFKKGR